MRPNWHALHAHLLRASSRGVFHRHFQTIRTHHPDLAPFGDPADLLDHQHRREGDRDAKDGVLRALVAEVQRQDKTAETASTLVILALWPGLDAIERRRRRFFRNDPAGLAGELIGRVGIAIARLDLETVNRVAGTLVRNVERDLMRMLRAQWADTRREVLFDEHVHKTAPDAAPSVLGLPCGFEIEAATERLEAVLRSVVGADAPLVLDIAVRGAPQREAAEGRGLTYEAGRKRYRRALERLRRCLGDF